MLKYSLLISLAIFLSLRASTMVNAGEMLSNPDFKEGLKSWETSRSLGGAVSKFQVSQEGPEGSACLKIDIEKPGVNTWDISLTQSNLEFHSNQTYRVSFWAKSEESKPVLVLIQQQNKPYKIVGDANKTLPLTTEWQAYSIECKPKLDETAARFTLRLGKSTGSFAFARFSVDAPTSTAETGQKAIGSNSESKLNSGDYEGVIKEIDLAKNVLTLTSKGVQKTESFSISKDTQVFLDGKTVKIEQIKTGLRAVVTPATDPLYADKVQIYIK